MDDYEKITITKLDAAHRQLATAIELWFADGDPVSIHALAYSAHEIIHRLYRLKGLNDLLFDSFLIKDEFRGDFANKMKESANFFKHAEREANPDHAIEFAPDLNTFFIAICITGLDRMGEKRNDTVDAFTVYLSLHRPSWFKKPIPVKTNERLKNIEKDDFFKAYLAVRREQ